MAKLDATVQIHLDFLLNGEPITRVLEAPVEIEEMEHSRGMVIHMHLDAAKFARAMSEVMVKQMRNTDGRPF